ncbi:hypothetical protein DSCA_29470 [Desulfosarcina alkanivorans]|uniref:Uncharacterized protein n=1 Tax=Desulfosarcina alkanivorans TaxID=571177 RepID=A0A5K7YWG1_9BACT|nr:hypothetical protein DSCA_29470 [Desulfosarcina alkanivorans]
MVIMGGRQGFSLIQRPGTNELLEIRLPGQQLGRTYFLISVRSGFRNQLPGGMYPASLTVLAQLWERAWVLTAFTS